MENKNLAIGAVFTPMKWATFAIETFGVLEKWLAGATVLDPTMGEGNLLIALIELGLSRGYALQTLPTHRLYGIELNEAYFRRFWERAAAYNLKRENFQHCDLFTAQSPQVDILLGNPPWQHLADLPESYKETAKRLFFQYELVGNAQDLLLGCSRMDIASLVIQKSMAVHLKRGGEAFFFLPLSLLLNDGASEHFRRFRVGKTSYALETVFDFGGERIFERVTTRYGLARFRRDAQTQYPVPYHILEGQYWRTLFARPLLHEFAPLSVFSAYDENPLEDWQFLPIASENTPRQGINTCGANDVFFFHTCEDFDKAHFVLNGSIILPKKFIYPLLIGKNFKECGTACKWVLLPYKPSGKPLEWEEIQAFPHLQAYLCTHKTTLESRRGTMLQATMKHGHWWALLGVGAYNFAPYKVVWEAYGRDTFAPRLFDGTWQANQSLQCFMPCQDAPTAERILAYLQQPAVEAYLLSMKMEGTMNWAQAGKVKRLFQAIRHTD